MISRPARWIVLAVFVAATLSSPVLALCESDPGSGCCCTQERKCPRPATAKAASAACCKSTPPAAPVTSGTPDRGAGPALDASAVDIQPVGSTTPPTRFAAETNPAADKNASGIGLFTLHAAFLI